MCSLRCPIARLGRTIFHNNSLGFIIGTLPRTEPASEFSPLTRLQLFQNAVRSDRLVSKFNAVVTSFDRPLGPNVVVKSPANW